MIREKVFVREEEFDCTSKLLCFLDFLIRILKRHSVFFISKKFSLKGYFEFLDPTITTFFSCLFMEGALFPWIIVCFKRAHQPHL